MNSLGGIWGTAAEAPRRVAAPLERRSLPFLVSLVMHLVLVLGLGLTRIGVPEAVRSLIIQAVSADVQEFELPKEVFASDVPQPDIGANSVAGDEMMAAQAPEFDQVPELANPVEYRESNLGEIHINRALERSTGLRFNENLAVKGAAGEGVTGADGAIDRITQEILLSLQERKTLVVWLLDQSPSLARQHQLIHARLDRIYEELGVLEAAGNAAFRRHDDKPLLTSVYWFGDKVRRVLNKPTDNLAEIKQAVSNIELDELGVERVFSAVYLAAKQCSAYRKPDERNGEPERNVLIVVFTDEAGEDQDGLEVTVKLCRRQGIPVYVVGVPAPFGRKEAYFKFVDPDPNYDQSPRWGVVDQGPETLLPERLQISLSAAPQDEVPIDSGFGPYALTRLCYETGGIYFAVHPNRNVHRRVSRAETEEFAAHIERFFDPQVMRRYRPDYVSAEEYQRQLKANAARAALVTAAQMSWVQALELPALRFVKRDDGQFLTELTQAQQAAALLEPQLALLYEALKVGEADRAQEASPRWQAGFDLAMGKLLATKTRAEACNALLAKAKRGMKFANPQNNTWVLRPSNDLKALGSQLEKNAVRAREYLERVVRDHAETPWALLAQQELDQPFGWTWVEEFTDLAPPPPVVSNPSPPPPPSQPADDRARQIAPPKPVRQFQKL